MLYEKRMFFPCRIAWSTILMIASLSSAWGGTQKYLMAWAMLQWAQACPSAKTDIRSGLQVVNVALVPCENRSKESAALEKRNLNMIKK